MLFVVDECRDPGVGAEFAKRLHSSQRECPHRFLGEVEHDRGFRDGMFFEESELDDLAVTAGKLAEEIYDCGRRHLVRRVEVEVGGGNWLEVLGQMFTAGLAAPVGDEQIAGNPHEPRAVRSAPPLVAPNVLVRAAERFRREVFGQLAGRSRAQEGEDRLNVEFVQGLERVAIACGGALDEVSFIPIWPIFGRRALPHTPSSSPPSRGAAIIAQETASRMWFERVMSSMRYCPACGAEITAGAFCRSCGAATGTKNAAAASTQPGDQTRVLPVVPVPGASGGAGGPGGMKRSSVIALIVGTGVVVGGIIVAVILLSGGSDEKFKPSAQPSATSSTTDTTSTTVLPPPDTTGPLLLKVESQLNASGAARKLLNDSILGPFQQCRLDGQSAAEQIKGVIANRTGVLNAATQMATSLDPTERDLGTKLRDAMQASLDSNLKYQAWFEQYAFSPACPSDTDFEKKLANADSERATQAKEIFVTTYNPLALTHGLRPWANTEI